MSHRIVLFTLIVLASSVLAVFASAQPTDGNGGAAASSTNDHLVAPVSFTGDVGTLPKGDAQAAADWRAAHPGQLLASAENDRGNPPMVTPNGGGALASPPPLATNVPAATNGFDGQNNAVQGQNVVPPDMGMAVGPTYVVQFVNSAGGGAVAVYNKTSGSLVTWFQFKSLFGSTTCGTQTSHSDPNALYDSARDRYFLLDFTTTSPEQWCVAYSKTNDPVNGGWTGYDVAVSGCGSTNPSTDYEHSGVWIDGIYTATGMYSSAGSFQNAGVFVWNRDDMYNGTTMRCGFVNLPTLKTGTAITEFRADPANYNVNTGIPASGTDEPTISLYNAGGGCTTCLAHIINVHTVWSGSGGTATLGTETDLAVTALTVAPPSTVTSTADKLDTLSYHSMQELQYYASGTNEYLLVGRTTANRAATTLTNPNWFEFTRANGGAWSIRQQAEFAPDNAISRMQPALAYDRAGNVIMDYTATSSTVNPDLRYTGRLFTDTLNTMQTEATSKASGGGFSATCGGTCTRWGDYSDAKVDPDGCKVWFSMEYMPATGLNWNTWIGATSFAPASCTTLSYARSAPASQGFGSVQPGSTSAAQTINVTNTGTGPLVLGPASVSGTNAADFAVTSDGCRAKTVAAGSSCSVTMTFTPGASGSRGATLSLGTNVAAADTVSIALTGTGITPPTTTASLSPAANANGWNNGPVTVTLTCTPASGQTCASTTYTVDGGATQAYSAPFTVSGDLAHTVLYQSTGSDGAVETAKTQLVKIDATAPAVSATGSCAVAGSNGWCKDGSRTITTTASDALSGLASSSCTLDGSAVACGNVTVGQGTHTVAITATDLAGNVATASKTMSLDNVAPTLNGSRSPAANAQGWNNVDVTASWSCTDATSGVASAPASQTVTTEGASQSRTGTCTDVAGNSASSTVTGISIDKTAPSLTGSRAPAANANGWNNANVVASWTCTDALSGVLSSPGSQTLSTEGAGQQATGTCTDNAGNSASNTVTNINIDKTAPTGTGSRSPSRTRRAGTTWT
jgi:hypothetical protein